MPVNIELIKKNYANFEDYQIEHIAIYDAKDLEPEVIPILLNEIIKRGMNPDLLKGVEAQINEISDEELDEVINKLKKLECPECRVRGLPLSGYIVRRVLSFIFFTSSTKRPIICCDRCAQKKLKSSMITTALFGWWGIPFGIFNTPIALISTLRDKKKKENISTLILAGFALKNIGLIRTNWNNETNIVDYIRRMNNSK